MKQIQLFTALYIILLFGISIREINAQSTLPKYEADSLWAIWQDETQADTSRLNAIYDYAWKGYRKSQPDSAFYFAQLQLEFAEKIGNKLFMGKAYNIQGEAFKNKNSHDSALIYFQKSIPINIEIDNKVSQAWTYRRIASVYERLNESENAITYHKKSLALTKELGNKKKVADGLHSIARTYWRADKKPMALDYLNQSLILSEEIDYKRGISHALVMLGIFYIEEDEYQKALDLLNKAASIKQEIGDKSGYAAALINIGAVYMYQEDYPNSLITFKKSLKISEELSQKHSIAFAHTNIGNIYFKMGEYEQALDYYQKGIKFKKEISDKRGLGLSYLLMTEFYFKQKQYQQTIFWAEKTLEATEPFGSLSTPQRVSKILYETYKALNKSDLALKYHEKMLVLADSMNREETTKKLQQMEFEKQMLADSISQAEEERLVKLAHEKDLREEAKTRNIAFLTGGLILLLAGGLYSRLRYVRKSKAILSEEKDRSENLLLNILPAEIAEELKLKGKADARDFDMVSILFTDFIGFTQTSEKLSASELVNEINHCFESFDHILEKYKIEKIKTIGDSYMAAGGLPVPTDDSVKNTVLAALEMQTFITKRKIEKDAKKEAAFEMRVGIHTGPVVAGIVGVKKFQYDIWGDTVNTASRVENKGEAGKVNISQATYEMIKGDKQFTFESRGKIKAKGKGEIEMYFATLKK